MQDSHMSVFENDQKESDTASVNPLKFLPPQLCGLDPLFHAFNRMYIKDILSIDEYPTLPGTFAYKNHPIFKVDILGIVVKVDITAKLYKYGVDDGTGVIWCCIWKENNYTCPASEISELNNSLPPSLANKVEQIKELLQMEFRLGDLIHVRGKITTFHQIRQIMANFAALVNDSLSEISYMVELPQLYKNIYNKPFQVSYQLNEEVKQSDKETIEKQAVEDLSAMLKVYLTENQKKFFDAQQLLQEKTLQSAILEISDKDERFADHQALLDLTLEAMEKSGEICRWKNKDIFESLLLPNSEMSALIVNILQKDKQYNTYSQNGCHVQKLFSQVKKTEQYVNVSMAAVEYCLELLEIKSDIIRTTDVHYMAC